MHLLLNVIQNSLFHLLCNSLDFKTEDLNEEIQKITKAVKETRKVINLVKKWVKKIPAVAGIFRQSDIYARGTYIG